MKKLLCILLSFLLLISLFAGCAGSKRLRVCIDLSYADNADNQRLNQWLYDLQYELEEFDGVENLVFEFIPTGGAERETALDRMRTEIMSGGGPDLFLINCAGAYNSAPNGEALFKMPEKAMALGLFLPLDEYMENNSVHAEWDKMTDVILDAGRNGEGQMIIPVTYTVPLAMYMKDEVPHTPSKTMTWQDMLNDDKLKDTAAVLADGARHPQLRDGQWSYRIDSPAYCMLGELADYEKENLSFTEEELKAYIDQTFELQEYTFNSGLYDREKWYEGYLGVGMNCCVWNQIETHGMTDEDIFSLVPFYSDDGGATGIILNYMAVNANTKRPEDAFKVIDRLMGIKMQQDDSIYMEYMYKKLGVMPMYDHLMQEDTPLNAHSYQHKYTFYSEENFETVCALRDSISRVIFPDMLTLTLSDLMLECRIARDEGEDYTQIVHEAYNAMELMVGE